MIAPLIDWGGTGPVIHLAVANGFPPETYRPLFSELLKAHRVVCLPPRALWPGQDPPPEQAGSWESLTEDLLAGWRHYQLEPVIALGHSFGAVASLLAAIRSSASVRALVLLDPTILPRQRMEQYAAEMRAGRNPRLPLVEMALKRKSRFSSPHEAFTYWRGKDLFREWDDTALQRYVAAVLRQERPGQWVLTWSPDWEAWYYRSFYPHTWDLVPQLDRSIPVLVVAGEQSDTFPPESATGLRNLMPHATFATIPGAGHLFPQSHPDAARHEVEQWLASIMREPRVSVS